MYVNDNVNVSEVLSPSKRNDLLRHGEHSPRNTEMIKISDVRSLRK